MLKSSRRKYKKETFQARREAERLFGWKGGKFPSNAQHH